MISTVIATCQLGVEFSETRLAGVVENKHSVDHFR